MLNVPNRAFSGFGEAVVLDVETTGLNFNKDRIVSLCLLKTNFWEFAQGKPTYVGTYKAKINPEIDIPESATNIHGISTEDVWFEDNFKSISNSLKEFIGVCPVIAHNCEFDANFLDSEFRRNGHSGLSLNRKFCTMKRMCFYLEKIGEFRSRISLKDSAEKFKIKIEGERFHDASYDAQIALQLAGAFFKLDNKADFELLAERQD